MTDRAQVRNASDPAQVKRAGRIERERAKEFLGNLRAVLDTGYGRSVMWEMLERAGVFRSIYHPSSAIYYNAGRQDYGHELLAALIEADPTLYQTMEREARERKTRDAAATDAAHTPSAEDQKAGGN